MDAADFLLLKFVECVSAVLAVSHSLRYVELSGEGKTVASGSVSVCCVACCVAFEWRTPTSTSVLKS